MSNTRKSPLDGKRKIKARKMERGLINECGFIEVLK